LIWSSFAWVVLICVWKSRHSIHNTVTHYRWHTDIITSSNVVTSSITSSNVTSVASWPLTAVTYSGNLCFFLLQR
jgi:hypothetical protein